MMRSKPASSLQKTYDECYLMCSTAVYFEGRNNEDEALRSWRSALETIYYHNAYRLPSKFTPKTETEKALQESLRQLEIQCRERVDLLQALHESRKDADAGTPGKEPFFKGKLLPKLNIASVPATLPSPTSTTPATPGWIADGTIPAVDYTDLSKPPTMPGRLPKASSESLVNGNEAAGSSMSMSNSNSNSNSSSRAKSRGSSPDKRKPMLMTLRNSDAKKHERRKKKKATLSPRQKDMRPTASKAAGLAWESVARSPSTEKVPTEAALVSSRLTVESDSGRKEMESRYGEELAKRSGRVDDNDIIPDLHWRVPDMPPRRTPAMSPPVRLPPAGSLVESQRKTSVPPPPNSPPPAPPRSPFTSLPNSPSLPPYPSYAPVSYSNNAINPPLSPKPSVKPKPAPKPASLTSSKPATQNARGLESDPERPSLRSSLTTDAKKRQSNSTSGARIASPTTKRRSSPSGDERLNRSIDKMSISAESPSRRKPRQQPRETPPSSDQESSGHKSTDDEEDDDAYLDILNKLPKGVDTASARQVLNDIVIRGDEVHWDDVAGLDAAKKALKEAVVYPFLRPDLFSGLREPARGMLLFGPPGTGKTMLARAVATESKSTFFSVSSSTLTSKWHGESEKLVRALFGLAKELAPSIIFVDEIDSLLSARSTGSEHEASRRSKTEFLVQWSDLQRAAAGREQSGKDKKEGDASRVLVLAATNMPWDIDEAARRRFVRRQYIPLPEHYVRAQQLKNLLSHQVHELSDDDIEVLVQVTEGFSGSDITALAKDAAMGPLRNLGEALLHTPIHQIRPIRFSDFEASLYSIRPSVSQDGLREYEEWAKKFGERGG